MNVLHPFFSKKQKGDLGNSRLVSLALVPGKIMQHMEKKVTGSYQHVGKSHLSNLLASWEEMTCLWMVGDKWASCTWSVARLLTLLLFSHPTWAVMVWMDREQDG